MLDLVHIGHNVIERTAAAAELQLLLLDDPGRMLAVLVADAAQHHPQPDIIRPGCFLLVRLNQLLYSAMPNIR